MDGGLDVRSAPKDSLSLGGPKPLETTPVSPADHPLASTSTAPVDKAQTQKVESHATSTVSTGFQEIRLASTPETRSFFEAYGDKLPDSIRRVGNNFLISVGDTTVKLEASTIQHLVRRSFIKSPSKLLQSLVVYETAVNGNLSQRTAEAILTGFRKAVESGKSLAEATKIAYENFVLATEVEAYVKSKNGFATDARRVGQFTDEQTKPYTKPGLFGKVQAMDAHQLATIKKNQDALDASLYDFANAVAASNETGDFQKAYDALQGFFKNCAQVTGSDYWKNRVTHMARDIELTPSEGVLYRCNNQPTGIGEAMGQTGPAKREVEVHGVWGHIQWWAGKLWDAIKSPFVAVGQVVRSEVEDMAAKKLKTMARDEELDITGKAGLGIGVKVSVIPEGLASTFVHVGAELAAAAFVEAGVSVKKLGDGTFQVNVDTYYGAKGKGNVGASVMAVAEVGLEPEISAGKYKRNAVVLANADDAARFIASLTGAYTPMLPVESTKVQPGHFKRLPEEEIDGKASVIQLKMDEIETRKGSERITATYGWVPSLARKNVVVKSLEVVDTSRGRIREEVVATMLTGGVRIIAKPTGSKGIIQGTTVRTADTHEILSQDLRGEMSISIGKLTALDPKSKEYETKLSVLAKKLAPRVADMVGYLQTAGFKVDLGNIEEILKTNIDDLVGKHRKAVLAANEKANENASIPEWLLTDGLAALKFRFVQQKDKTFKLSLDCQFHYRRDMGLETNINNGVYAEGGFAVNDSRPVETLTRPRSMARLASFEDDDIIVTNTRRLQETQKAPPTPQPRTMV